MGERGWEDLILFGVSVQRSRSYSIVLRFAFKERAFNHKVW
ncbi:hypothetical protein IC007_0589 [Sulfuracidifex tepidarius]|uniref:Uncharacterized protein n=1 Tax=Sulfuracidifex tepidarius TaxID=1294262 RepID=A0A510E0R9_9CREN|nr:hypothetical protein IC007_0589 [Sulfuracidifex tepidarius]